MMDKDKIMSQLNDMDLSYDDLNRLQVWLVNNGYIPIMSLVFRKEELFDEDCFFYFEDEKVLSEYIERGNGKYHDREYCQIVKDSLYFYNFDKMKDIIINYLLYDSLEKSNKIVEYLNKKFGVKINGDDNMVVVYLTKEMREELLAFDIENTEHSFDRDMYYITNTENQILHDIIDGKCWFDSEKDLRELGLDLDFSKLYDGKFVVEFTDKDECYMEV